VNDGLNIVSLPVDCKMHPDFTGHFSCTGQLPTFKIDDHHIGRSEQVLAGSGGTSHYPFLVQSDRDYRMFLA
jgi:hypothetical protein